MSEAASDAVNQLLPDNGENDLPSLCAWADRMRFRYHWSAPLHYINTPDTCTYEYASKFMHTTSYSPTSYMLLSAYKIMQMK